MRIWIPKTNQYIPFKKRYERPRPSVHLPLYDKTPMYPEEKVEKAEDEVKRGVVIIKM